MPIETKDLYPPPPQSLWDKCDDAERAYLIGLASHAARHQGLSEGLEYGVKALHDEIRAMKARTNAKR